MFLINQREKLDDVFKARGQFEISKYIKRETLENKYDDAIKSGLSILVRGNSGVGKSWLTYYMMQRTKLSYNTVNLALVSQYGSLYNFFRNAIPRLACKYSDTKEASVNVALAEGKTSVTNEYEIGCNCFVEYLKHNKCDYIIFENFESITDNDIIIKELGCLITLMDDEYISSFNTKFIIIGTNTDIQRFFSYLPNVDTIDNRLRELPEIKGFLFPECSYFVTNGFKKLGIHIPITMEADTVNKIFKYTCGIPQRVHELCRIIAKYHIDNNKDEFSNDYWDCAQKDWLSSSFSKNYAILSDLFRNNVRANNNNNYVLYMISEIDDLQFDHLKIQAKISETFPRVNIGKTVVKNYLRKLSDTSINNNILSLQGNDYYSVRDTKTILCLRSMLYLDGEIVKMHDIQEL